jgi:hypothetical protein
VTVGLQAATAARGPTVGPAEAAEPAAESTRRARAATGPGRAVAAATLVRTECRLGPSPSMAAGGDSEARGTSLRPRPHRRDSEDRGAGGASELP